MSFAVGVRPLPFAPTKVVRHMRLNSKTSKWLRTLALRRALHSPLHVDDGYEPRKHLRTRETQVGKDILKVPVLGPTRLREFSMKWWYRRLKNNWKKGLDL